MGIPAETVRAIEQEGTTQDFLAASPPAAAAFCWLGQAGFAFRTPRSTVLMDPYLSDSLSEKYRGRELPHLRMMPPPVAPEDLRGVEAVLCSHRHSDHMDPGTLPLLAERNPACRFVVPRAELTSAQAIGLPAARLLPIGDGECIELLPDVRVCAIPSAHEELRVNESGQHHYLGFILTMAGFTVYHSGDCVPYIGLVERLAGQTIDVAFLPVNGRDAFRRERGVPGNMTADEALELCRQAGIGLMVAHHFGMFEFNTVAPETIAQAADRLRGSVTCVIPTTGQYWTLSRSKAPTMDGNQSEEAKT